MRGVKSFVLISLLCSIHGCTALPPGVDQSVYCESCLATAKEIESLMKDASSGGEREVIEKVVSSAICDHVPFPDSKPKGTDQMKTACMHLLDLHHDEFREALQKRIEHVAIFLCYELSTACVGVKRQKSEDEPNFQESDIHALLSKNVAKVRTTQPVRPLHPKDEL